MLYILAVFMPPLACLGRGKFLHFLISLVVCATIVGWPVAVLHAWVVVGKGEAK